MSREFGPFTAHPFFQLGNERRAPLLAHSKAFGCGNSIDAALDVEQGIIQKKIENDFTMLTDPNVFKRLVEEQVVLQ